MACQQATSNSDRWCSSARLIKSPQKGEELDDETSVYPRIPNDLLETGGF